MWGPAWGVVKGMFSPPLHDPADTVALEMTAVASAHAQVDICELQPAPRAITLNTVSQFLCVPFLAVVCISSYEYRIRVCAKVTERDLVFGALLFFPLSCPDVAARLRIRVR